MRVKPIIAGLGVAAIAVGILWAAQGSGLFPYPRASFMIDQRPWILRGALLAAAGLALLLYARRR